MLMKGAGMLCTSMDIDPGDETEFNRWFDKEHMEERVRIPGFFDARRYESLAGFPHYLNLYETKSLNVFNSSVYRERLASQTKWSLKIMGRFKNFNRIVGQISVSQGFGHGAYVGLVWLKPAGAREDDLRNWFALKEFPILIEMDEILSIHVLEPDPVLSGPPPGVSPSATQGEKGGHWIVIVEGTNSKIVSDVCQERFTTVIFKELGMAKEIHSGLYKLRSSFGIRNEIM
jgi:hypothetical protein